MVVVGSDHFVFRRIYYNIVDDHPEQNFPFYLTPAAHGQGYFLTTLKLQFTAPVIGCNKIRFHPILY
jgi:hypothetical protein